MGTEITIDPQSGILRIGGATLQSRQPESEIEPHISQWLNGQRDYGNGYKWLYLRGLTFGDQPASVNLCLHDGRLEWVSWSVQLPDAPMEGGWLTREAIDMEVLFVRRILAQNDINVGECTAKFHWGEVWSYFDAKGFLASNGLRYRPSFWTQFWRVLSDRF